MTDLVVNYADLATVQKMLASTGSVYDPNTTDRLTSLITAISRLIEDVLGRTFGQPGPDTTVLIWAKGGNQLILPKPAWSITSITTGGTVIGDAMTGGTPLTSDQWVVGIEDQAGQIYALDRRDSWWGAGVPVSVTGQFADVESASAIPGRRGGKNWFVNPSCEVNATGWGVQAGASGARSTENAAVGSASFKAVIPLSSQAGVILLPDRTNLVATGVSHLFSAACRVWMAAGAVLRRAQMSVYYSGQPTQVLGVDTIVGTGAWQTIKLGPFASDPTLTITNLQLTLYNLAPLTPAITLYIDAIDWRIDEPDCDEYIDGSLGTRYAWTGAAHASTSTRAPVLDPYVPADLALAANQLVCETYKLQNLPVVTDDGIVVPRRDPWADPLWLNVKEKYEISARELVV